MCKNSLKISTTCRLYPNINYIPRRINLQRGFPAFLKTNIKKIKRVIGELMQDRAITDHQATYSLLGRKQQRKTTEKKEAVNKATVNNQTHTCLVKKRPTGL